MRSALRSRAARALVSSLFGALSLAAAPSPPTAPAQACVPQAHVLGVGTRDVADASELVGGDGAPDLVLAVRACRTGPLRSVAVVAAEGKPLWDTEPNNQVWFAAVAAQQEPGRLLARETYAGEAVPLAGGADAPRSGSGLELALYVSPEGGRPRALEARAKVVLRFQEGGAEEIPFTPPPSPLPPRLSAMLKPAEPAPEPINVLLDFDSEDARRRFEGAVALADAVKRLDPKQSLPVFERFLRQKRASPASPDLKRAATMRALRVLGPRALPLAPLLITDFHDVDPEVVAQKRRALLAMGPDVAPALLGAPEPDKRIALELFEQLEPTAERYVRLLPLLNSKDARVAATAATLVKCGDVGARTELLRRAAKVPRTVEAARQALDHKSGEVRPVAGAVAAWAGERTEKVRRALKHGYETCGGAPGVRPVYAELLGPESAQDSLVIANVGFDQDGRAVLEPLVLFRTGEWERALGDLMTGPATWLGVRRSPATGVITRSDVIPAEPKATGYARGCGSPGRGFKVPKIAPKTKARLALSQHVTLIPFEPPSPELEKSQLRFADGQRQDVLREAKRAFRDRESLPCGSKDLDDLAETNEAASEFPTHTVSCGKQVPGLGQVCYLRRFRGYRSGKARAESACEGGCMTELWTADSGKGPRVLSVSHDCDLDKNTGGAPPFAALALNGRTFFLSDVTCHEGCEGVVVLEATATGVTQRVTGQSAAVCD